MFSIRKEKKYIKITLLLVCSIFLLTSIYCNFKYGDYNLLGTYEAMDNDDVKYIRSAWTLLEEGRFTYHDTAENTVFIMPGLPFTLAFFIGIFGRFQGVMAFRVFQSVLQSLSILLIFFLGRKLFNSKVGLLAVILDVLYIPELGSTNVILTEVIFKFLLLLLIYICLYAVDTKKTSYYVIGGIVWGITALFRPTIAAFPVVILGMWIYKKYKFKEILKYTLITTAVFSLVMSPWWIRNYITFNRFIPLTLSSGNPLIQGSYIKYDKNIDFYPWKSVEDRVEQEYYFKENFKYRFKNYMLKKPYAYAKWYFVDKSLELWNAPFYWKEILEVPIIKARAYHLLILSLGAAGIITAFRDYKGGYLKYNFLLPFWVIIYFIVLHIPYVTFSRYSYPAMPIMILFCAYVIYGLSKQIFLRKP